MYTKEQAVAATIEYYKNAGFTESLDIMSDVGVNKYLLKDKAGSLVELTPDDMHKRLAREFFRVENSFDSNNPFFEDEVEIYDLLKNFKYIVPQGSPMFGIGNNYVNVSLSNCVVVESPEDSMTGIMNTCKDLANLMKRRCGVGVDISTLRPEGAPVNNSALTTTGAWSFADLFSFVCRSVGQNGRRGALMISINCKHPDVLKFVTMKNDKTKVTGANVSIHCTDEFMDAVVNDRDFTLQWPIDSDNPVVTKTIRALDLWNMIGDNATFTAEPGVLLWDTILKYLPANYYPMFKTVTTNPCQPAEALVLTPLGIRTFGDIEIGDKIWSETGWTTVVNKWSNGIKKVYNYETNVGQFLGTENHKVVSNKSKIEVSQAKSIDFIRGNFCDESQLNTIDSDYVMAGLLIGDGSVHMTSKDKIYLNVGEKDTEAYLNSEVSHLMLEPHPAHKDRAYKVVSNVVSVEDLQYKVYERNLSKYMSLDFNRLRSLLRGIYSANGSVCDNRITLKSASKQLIRDVQVMLNAMGIESYITTNKPTNVKWDNGNYISKESYDLNITRDRSLFVKYIGFIHSYKNDKINTDKISYKPRKLSYEIVDYQYVGEMEVFDITVDNETHTYWTAGCNVSNCGEIPLSAYDSCRLISVNLANLVIGKFTSQARIDWSRLENIFMAATRLSDDLVELEIEKITNIINIVEDKEEKLLWTKLLNAAQNGRRTGLGTHGLADMLAQLRIPYDSEAALEIVDKVYEKIRDTVYMESIVLAKERGAFPVFDWNLEKDCPYIQNLPDHIKHEMEFYGRRNISLLTNAPTGTTALVSGNVSSGCEPVWKNLMKRRVKLSDHNSHNETPDFVDELGDKWKEYYIYHPNLVNYFKLTNQDHNDKNVIIPDFFTESGSIDWMNRVKLQGVMQKYIDHSISSTINLPAGTDPSVVKNIYIEAWKHGLKGVTVYVEGSRDGVLISAEEKSEPKNVSNLMDLIIENGCISQENLIQLKNKNEEDPLARPFNDTVIPSLVKQVPDYINSDMSVLRRGGKKFYLHTSHFVQDRDLKFPVAVWCQTNNVYDNGEPLYLNKARTKFAAFMISEGIDEDLVNAKIEKVKLMSDYIGRLTKLISMALRHNISLVRVVEALEDIDGDNMFTSLSVLRKFLASKIENGTKTLGIKCPECSSQNLVYTEGCKCCKDCGYSACN